MTEVRVGSVQKITVNEQTTFVKRVTVGVPVASINEASSGVVSGTGREVGDILVSSPGGGNLFTPGKILGGHGINKDYDSSSNNITLSVDSSDLKSIIDSNYVAFVMGQDLDRVFVDSAYVEQNSLDSERTLALLDSELQNWTTSIIPYYDSQLDLGSPTKKWRRLYLSGNTIVLGNLTLGDESGTFTIRDSAGSVAAYDLTGNTTTDLGEGTNLYYTRARFDSALGDTTSTQTIRGYINVIDAGGDGSFTYDSSLGKITYTGPSAAEVRAHFSGQGDLSYDSSTGVFSIDVEQIYSKANFDSDLGDANTDQLPEGVSNLYYTNARVTAHVDSAYVQARQQLVDSASIIALVDSNYVQARQQLVDSASIIALVDSNYIALRIGGPFVDSAYVATAISNLVDGAPGALDTLNELAAALNDDSDAYNTLLSQINALPDSAQVQLIIDQAYIRARQITYNTSDFADSSYVQTYFSNNVPRFGTDYIDSATASTIVTSTVDSNYIAGKIGGPFIDSAYFAANIPTFGTDYVDSGYVTSYVTTYVEQNSLDSERTIALIDSNYIAFRIGGPFIDSAYFDTNIPKFGTDYIDSAAASIIITSTIDSNYIASKIGGPFIDSAYFDTNIPKLGTDYVDSAQVLLIVDSDYVVQRMKGLEGDISITLADSSSASGPTLTLYRNSASPADSDIIGEIIFKGQDDSGNAQEFAKIRGVIKDASGDSEDGSIETFILENGFYTQITRQSVDGFEILNNIPLSLNGNIVYKGTLVDSSWVGERARTITAPEIKYIDVDDSASFGPHLILDRNSASPADSDAIGLIELRGRNSADSDIKYASIEGFIDDASANSEDGEIKFHIAQNGFDRTKLSINRTGIELGIQEKIIFQTDSYQQSIQPGAYTAAHALTLPDSTGTLLTVDHMFKLIDSAYVGARQGATGATLNFKDRDSNLYGLTVVETVAFTGGIVSLGNTVTLLNEDSAEILIAL